MKIGLLTSVLSKNMGYAEAVDWAGSNGFENLEIDAYCSDVHNRRALLDVNDLISGGDAALRKYTEPLRRHNISVGSLFYYRVNNLDPDREKRRLAQHGLKNTIRTASLLGVPVVVTAVGSPLEHSDASRLNPWGIYYHGAPNATGRQAMQEGFQVFAENYLPLADFAREHGVKIAFEPSAVGGGAGAVAHSPETFDALFDLVQHPSLGLNFDPSHFHWQGIDYIAYAARLARAGLVFSCHGKDSEILWTRVKYAGFLGDGWWRHRLPGWGQVDWPALIKTLQDNGYNSVINVEHEDPLFGWQFDEQGRIVDIELAKRGCQMGLAYLRHAQNTAGL